jgi:hypothetical protein
VGAIAPARRQHHAREVPLSQGARAETIGAPRGAVALDGSDSAGQYPSR